MKWNTSFIVVLLSMLVLSCVTHASDYKCVLGNQGDKSFTQVKEDKSAMNNAIKIYLDKIPLS